MRKLTLIFILCFISISLFATEIKEKEFKVTFTITFSSMTLKQAAETEKEISKLFKNFELNITINNKQENDRYYFIGNPDNYIKTIDDGIRVDYYQP